MHSAYQVLSIVGSEVDAPRARRLVSVLRSTVTVYAIGADKLKAACELWHLLRSKKWHLVYLEGTGIAAGGNLILARLFRGQAFVVSSGDPISGFMHVVHGRLLGWVFGVYERMLYAACRGYIGRTPYLTDMALKLGAPRAVTVIESVDLEAFSPCTDQEKKAAKIELGIDPDHLVCGVVGNLNWVKRQSYCYGLELIEALVHLHRKDVSILIIGDGTGRSLLEKRVPEHLRDRVVFTGRIQYDRASALIKATDVGFVTQTLDQLGNFRITSKLTSYLACGIPVGMSPIPAYYDYASDAGWVLPALHPADHRFHVLLAQWLDSLTGDEIAEKRANARHIAEKYFDYKDAQAKFCEFIESLLANESELS